MPDRGTTSPEIGVLITYYGERDLLRECLESLGKQVSPPHEILVYDDASEYPAEHYLPPNLPVRVVRATHNRGPAHGRNQLLQTSKSAYVHFHDADDLFEPTWHQRVQEVLAAQPVDAVFTEIDARTENGPDTRRILTLDALQRGQDLVRFCIQGIMLVPSGTYRRERLLAIGGYRTSLWQAEDFDFHVRLAASRPTYAVITDSLVTIRVRAASRSRNQTQTWTSFTDAVRTLADELPTSYRPDLADAAARAGSKLFKLGARTEARVAFRLAARLGPPRFTTQRPMYQFLAKTVGFEMTERLAGAYRGILPTRVRGYIGRTGS